MLKYLIIGRSGVGKDTLADYMSDMGLRQLLSYTTRPMRSPDEATHNFVTEEEAAQLTDRVAQTTIDGYEYFATRHQLNLCDTYVIDPQGADELVRNCPDMEFHIVYVMADHAERKARAIARAEDPETEAKVFDSRDADESPRFDEFEKSIIGQDDLSETGLPNNVVALSIVQNDYQPQTLLGWAKTFANLFTVRERLRSLIQASIDYDVFQEADETHVKVAMNEDGKPVMRPMTFGRLADILVHDDEGLAQFIKSLLGQVELVDRP